MSFLSLKNLKSNLIWEIISGLHKAEKDEVNGKFPLKFYTCVFVLPLLIAGYCTYKFPNPNSEFNATILQILSIVTGLLISSLVPFYEIASTNILNNLAEKKLKSVNIVRVQVMLISYSVIAFSLLLSVLGVVASLLVNLEFTLFNNLSLFGFDWSKSSKIIDKGVVFTYYSLLIINLSNLFNIIKYTNSLVRPVLTEISKIQVEEESNDYSSAE